MQKIHPVFARALSVLLVLAMLLGMMPPSAIAAAPKTDEAQVLATATASEVTDSLTQEQKLSLFEEIMNPEVVTAANIPGEDEEVRVIVELETASLLELRDDQQMTHMAISDFMTTDAAREQLHKIGDLQQSVLQQMKDAEITQAATYTYSAITSGFAASVPYGSISEIEAMDGVRRVVLCETYYLDVMDGTTLGKALSGAEIAAYSNNTEFQGEGMLIGILDTGLDWTHEAFVHAPNIQKLQKSALDKMVKYDQEGNEYFLYSYAALWYAQAHSSSEMVLLTADDLYKSEKVPFGFDYADVDADIIPSAEAVASLSGSHGTHVAGIAAGKTIEENGEVSFVGQAPEAQLAIFKVFSDTSGGASSDVVLAALNDAIILGVDVINMSLGSPGGFSQEPDASVINAQYDAVEAAGILLNCSAGNNYSSSYGGVQSDLPSSSDPDFGVTGSASSYDVALSVASVNASETVAFTAGQEKIPYTNVVDRDFAAPLLGDRTEATLEYVMIPGTGTPEDYTGLDISGKIAVVARGDLSFNDKQLNAANAGAVGCIIYNNVHGYALNMQIDDYRIPTASISYDCGLMMAEQTDKKLTVSSVSSGTVAMSDFSSWGPTPSLALKPEITAPGGDIYSSLPFGDYGYMSGTSMAAPYMAGVSAAANQYVIKMYPALSVAERRDLVNRLLMSTADILFDDNGVAYSPRKQGAGMTDLAAAVSTPAYLYVRGEDKPKIELGDDVHKTGIYDLAFQVKNMTSSPVSYKISTLVQTETVSADGKLILQSGYALAPTTEILVTGGQLEQDVLTVPANGEASVTVIVTLSQTDRDYMDKRFENGIYVEGFVELRGNGDPSLSIPFLGFYGDWTQAPIFEEADYYNGEPVKMYPTTPSGVYANTYIWPLGEYSFIVPDGMETPKPSADLISVNVNGSSAISGLYYLQAGLLRGAKTADITITDRDTGKVIQQWHDINDRKAMYNASYGTVAAGLMGDFWPPMGVYGQGTVNVSSNTPLNYAVTAYVDADGAQRNKNNTYSFDFTSDSEMPFVVNRNDLKFYKGEDGRVYLDVILADNFALAGATLYSANEYSDDEGYEYVEPGSNYYVGIRPALKEDGGFYRYYEECAMTFDVTDFYLQLSSGIFYILAYDYALNECCLEVHLNKVPVTSIALDPTEVTLPIRGYTVLNATLEPELATNQKLTWTSSNSAVVQVKGGIGEAMIVAKATGSATITARSQSNGSVTAQCTVTVTEEMGPEVPMTDFTLNYTAVTVNAGSTFSSLRMSAYNPFAATNTELTWSSADETIATVDDAGKITGISGGSTIITAKARLGEAKYDLPVMVNGAVAGEGGFTIEGDVLIAYTGGEAVVTIPDGIREIADNAFKNKATITEINCPDSVKVIGKQAFYSCTALTKISLPATMERIGEQAFYNCSKLESLGLDDQGVIPKGLTEIAKGTFYLCRALTGDVVIPDTVTTIGGDAFNYAAITSVVIPDSVTSMTDTSTFSNASMLERVVLSANLTELPARCFSYCSALTTLPDLKNVKRIGSSCFTYTGITELTIPASVTFIGTSAFANNSKLEKVHMAGAPELEGNTFQNNAALTSFTGNITTIANNMFSSCKALASFVMPDKVSYIGDSAFNNCTSLESITFPASYSPESLTIGISAFPTAAAFQGFTVEDGCAAVKTESNFLLSGDGKILYAINPSSVTADLVIPDGVEVIGSGAFYSKTAIKTVTFPATLKSIEARAFERCTGLTEINIPTGSVSIGNAAFSGCSGLLTLDLRGVSKVGEGAFLNCGKVTTMALGENLTSISYQAFRGMTKLPSVTIPASVATIGDEAFYNCTALTSATFHENLSAIGARAFYSCGNLLEIVLPDSLVTLGDYAFYGCRKATVIDCGGATEILPYTFYNCNAVTTLILGDGTRSIGQRAFYYCQNLAEVQWPASLETIDTYAFYYCTKLKTMDFSGTKLKFIGKDAFNQCHAVETLVFPDTLEHIDNWSFYRLNYSGSGAFVSTIHIPASVTYIDPAAFTGASKLQAFTVDENNPVYVAQQGILFNKLTGELLIWPAGNTTTEFAIPETMTAIPSGMLRNNTTLKKLTVHGGVTSVGSFAFGSSVLEEVWFEDAHTAITIGNDAFSYCKSLKSVRLPNGLTSLDGNAFLGCSALTSIDLPDTLTDLGTYAFAFCTSLADVKLSAGMTYLPGNCFNGCTGLTEITLPAAMQDVGMSNANALPFASCTSLVNIWVDPASRNLKSADGILYDYNGDTLHIYPAGRTAESYMIPEGTIRVDNGAACDNKYLKSVSFPSTMTRIGNKAFYNCSNLKNLYFNGMTAPILETNSAYTGAGTGNYAYYMNFIGMWASSNSSTGKLIPNTYAMNLYYPEGATGYDAYVWRIYFQSGTTNTMDASYYTVRELRVTEIENRSAELTWEPARKSAAEEITYKVERSIAVHIVDDHQDTWLYDGFETIAEGLNDCEYIDTTTLDFGRHYAYRVSAFDKAGETGPAAVATLYIDANTANPDELAALEVIRAIEALKPVDGLSLENEETVQNVLEMYEALTEEQQALVSNYPTLLEALARMDQLHAKEVMSIIDALPDPEKIDLDDKEAVEAARGAYEALTGRQKELVENLEKLLACEQALEDDHSTNEVRGAKEATCTEDGYTGDTYCTKCGQLVKQGEKIPALGHKTEIRGQKEPTCTEAGFTGNEVCTVCGVLIQAGEVIEAKGHQTELKNAKEATCTGTGYTGDLCCSVCEEVIEQGEIIPALGHKTELRNAKEATCTETGYTGDLCCSVCEEVIEQGEVIPALGHTTEIRGQREPTCTEAGFTGNEVCTVCGTLVQAGEVIQAVGHTTEPRNVKDATCTEDGYTGDLCCTVCEEVIVRGEVIPACCPSAPFTDLDTSAWYHEYTDFVIRNGLMNGVSEARFAPSAALTRGQLVTILYRMENEPKVTGESPFVDVAENKYYTAAVIWAAQNGLVNGMDATSFAPDLAISREQMVTIMSRYAGYKGEDTAATGNLDGYDDQESISEYAKDAMLWAVETGLIQGMGGSLKPRDAANRAQVATIITRLVKLIEA